METKFDIGETVCLKATVTRITINKNGETEYYVDTKAEFTIFGLSAKEDVIEKCKEGQNVQAENRND